MKEKIYECEVLSPMFIGGAKPLDAELRPPTIKGALRFWWRAMHGNLDIKELKEKENEVFGSGGGDNPTKSKVWISVENISGQPQIKDFPESSKITVKTPKGEKKVRILDYLAFGLTKFENGRTIIEKKYFGQGTLFNIRLGYDEKLDEKLQKEIELAFHFLSYFGGLGAKSRNGFGRFQILNADYKYDEIINLVKKFNFEKPSWTAFSTGAKIFQSKQDFNSWSAAVSFIGTLYVKNKININKKILKIKKFAKPMFLSIVRKGDRYSGVILIMPSRYLIGYEYLPKSKYKFELKDFELENYQRMLEEYVNEFIQKLKTNEQLKLV